MKNSTFAQYSIERNEILNKLIVLTKDLKENTCNEKSKPSASYIDLFETIFPKHITKYFLTLDYDERILFLRQNTSTWFCFLFESIDNPSAEAIKNINVCRSLKYVNCSIHNKKNNRCRAEHYIEHSYDDNFKLALCNDCTNDLISFIKKYRGEHSEKISCGAFSVECSKGNCHFCATSEDIYLLRLNKIRVRICKHCMEDMIDNIYGNLVPDKSE